MYNPQENGLVEIFNRYIKQGVEAFTTAGTKWADGLRRMLLQFRATAPTADGKSPAELFLGRRIRMDHEFRQRKIADVSPSHQGEEERGVEVTPVASKQTVKWRRGPFKRGDYVMTKKAHHLKGTSPYSEPKTVVEVIGDWTYRLSDGQRWNARKMKRFPAAAMTTFAETSSPTSVPTPAAQTPPAVTTTTTVTQPVAPPAPMRQSTRSTRGKAPRRYGRSP